MIISPDHFLYTATGEYYYSPARVDSAWRLTKEKVGESLPAYSRLVLLVGLPGAGKSTWLKTNARRDSLYVDATLSLRLHREPFVALAASVGRPISVVWVDTDILICRERNNLRTPDRRVPDDVLQIFNSNLQAEPPCVDEGFQEIVRIGS